MVTTYVRTNVREFLLLLIDIDDVSARVFFSQLLCYLSKYVAFTDTTLSGKSYHHAFAYVAHDVIDVCIPAYNFHTAKIVNLVNHTKQNA